jgi:hypothetical protein
MSETNGDGLRRPLASADLAAIQTEPPGDQLASSFYDPREPIFAPAKPIDSPKKKSWKRKLIGWCFVLLLIGGGAVALYLLLRINRVNVSVQADPRRDAQNAKLKPDSNNSENGLTADAINIAREAAGADTANSASPTPSPGTSPLPSPSPPPKVSRDLGFTGNLSPVNEIFKDAGSNGYSKQEQSGGGTQQQEKTAESSATVPTQTRANGTLSIFVDDMPPKATLTQQLARVTQTQSFLERRRASSEKPRTSPAVLPPFGTMLPVRTQGVVFTLRNNSYARLELTRDCEGSGWSLPKGTVLVGRTTGSEYDRAFVSVIGYIDPRENKLVKMTGDVLGSDGAAGIPGKRIGVDRNRLRQTLRKVASSGVQVAATMAGALGHGTVVVDGAGNRVFNPLADEARGTISGNDGKSTFVKVEAGRPAYVMVADMPKSLQAIDAPGDNELAQSASLTGSLTDREVMELILFGTPEEIRAATPLMTEDQKRLILKTLAPENEKR